MVKILVSPSMLTKVIAEKEEFTNNERQDCAEKVSDLRLGALTSFGCATERCEDLQLQTLPLHRFDDSDAKKIMYTGLTIELESKNCTADVIGKLSKLIQEQHFQKHIYICDDQNALKTFDVSKLNAYTHSNKNYVCIAGKSGVYEVMSECDISKDNTRYRSMAKRHLKGSYQAIALVHRPKITRHEDAVSIDQITIGETVIPSIQTDNNAYSKKQALKRTAQLAEHTDGSTDSNDIFVWPSNTPSKRFCPLDSKV